ncbi:enhancer of mRNA-decapping protein 3 [Clupea harengus]|uniref:Enhancer of mRNA-decapping protein 3 n=1 Tax=Clupea harengus TaxID=7950 RepID=A0A6P8F6A6_CLUHA|nr:enhancer of mRNA-decapping protein 3 [Clupea harengus]XP_031420534.1 enhancer of mRNA-decapping protein 3 [Clupea harengus]
MAADWLGSLVSINCGPTLGVYQGEVYSVDQSSQTISLRQPFHNGVKCPVPEVTFSAMDIKDLKILNIHGSSGNGITQRSVSDVAASMGGLGSRGGGGGKTGGGPTNSTPMVVPSRAEQKAVEGHGSPQQPGAKSYGERHADAAGQTKGFRRRHNSWSSSSRGGSQATPKKNGMKNGGGMKNKDDECFGDVLDDGLDEDFDFEGNLALFDKAAVFSQIETSRSRGTPEKQTQPARYRHDENILENKPVIYRQIAVPQPGAKEYCTDCGLVVPSVSYELHKRLLSVAERHGLSLERRLEMTGVCASQMALTLLGGPNRLTPKNVHQRPTVVLLCGPHVQGAQGISCGRHLSNHDVEVILFLPNFVKMLEAITSELSLFSKTGGKQVASVKDLPTSPVDLVINCLDSHENAFLQDQPWYRAAGDWASQNRAPVLSIDPPVSGQEAAVEAKWSLSLGLPLPLSESGGRVYLCDIGVPKQVFQEVGIKYHSPFGCKFVIPLHSP